MATATTAPRETTPSHLPAARHRLPGANQSATTKSPADQVTPLSYATDDEILGLGAAISTRTQPRGQLEFDWETTKPDTGLGARQEEDKQLDSPSKREPQELFREVFDNNPELRRAWEDVSAYRETFPTPREARTAGALLADLNRMDALFFSRRPEDHAELARAVAALDPSAFNSLAQAMTKLASAAQSRDGNGTGIGNSFHGSREMQATAESRDASARSHATAAQTTATTSPTSSDDFGRNDGARASLQDTRLAPAQAQFLQTANAAVVEEVLEVIESQVERLLPEETSKSARNRVIGEVYRELDTTLRANRQLARQMHEAFRSGALEQCQPSKSHLI
jgi:hypothetical protein